MVGRNVVNDKFNQTISANTELYPIVPSIPEYAGTANTSSCTRIGEKVKPRSLIVRGTIQYDESITADYVAPNTVRVMILANKKVKTNGKISTDGGYASLLKDAAAGTSVGRPYGAGAYDNLAPINTDLFKVYFDKKYTMREHIVAGLGTTGITSVQGTQPAIHFKVKIPCPSHLSFDDTTGDDPNNFAPFICVGGVPDDNSSAFTLTPVYRVRVQSVLYYEDA